MPCRIDIHNRVIATVCEEIIAYKVAVCSKITGVIGGDKPTHLGVVVAGCEVVEVEVIVVVIASVSKGVMYRGCVSSAVMVACAKYSAPSVVSVGYKLRSRGIINCNYIALQVLFVSEYIQYICSVAGKLCRRAKNTQKEHRNTASEGVSKRSADG